MAYALSKDKARLDKLEGKIIVELGAGTGKVVIVIMPESLLYHIDNYISVHHSFKPFSLVGIAGIAISSMVKDATILITDLTELIPLVCKTKRLKCVHYLVIYNA